MRSIHGPEIEVIDNSREAGSQQATVTTRLSGPYMFQEDFEGNVLVANCFKDSLLLFTNKGEWYDVTPNGGLRGPSGALWLYGRLYVSSWVDKSITVFE